MEALDKAVLIMGSQEKLAKAIGTNQQNISNWLKTGVPPIMCRVIEDATGVTRHELRPDIFDE